MWCGDICCQLDGRSLEKNCKMYPVDAYGIHTDKTACWIWLLQPDVFQRKGKSECGSEATISWSDKFVLDCAIWSPRVINPAGDVIPLLSIWSKSATFGGSLLLGLDLFGVENKGWISERARTCVLWITKLGHRPTEHVGLLKSLFVIFSGLAKMENKNLIPPMLCCAVLFLLHLFVSFLENEVLNLSPKRTKKPLTAFHYLNKTVITFHICLKGSLVETTKFKAFLKKSIFDKSAHA